MLFGSATSFHRKSGGAERRDLRSLKPQAFLNFIHPLYQGTT